MTHGDRYGTVLRLIVEASKRFVDAPNNSSASTYFTRLWKARVKMKDAVVTLPTVTSLSGNLSWDVADLNGVINELLELGLVFSVESSEGSDPLLVATIDAVELLALGRASIERLDNETLSSIREQVGETMRFDTYKQLGESIAPGKVTFSAKMAVFGVFLLLVGAVRSDSALIVETNESSQELEYLSALANHMDDVSRVIFPRSHTMKGAKGGKSFRIGQLDDTLRRRKELELAVGHQVFIYDDKASTYYLNVYEGDSLRADTLTTLLKILVGRICHYSVGTEWDPSNLLRAVDEYQFKNPIPVAYRRFLFKGSPPNDWYFVFRYYLEEALGGLKTLE